MRRFVFFLTMIVLAISLSAQEGEQQAAYSPAVVAKAEKVLADAGLRQSGKSIQSTGTSEIGRGISGISRSKRELRLVYQEWAKIDQYIAQLKDEQKRLNAQYADFSLQLARVAGNVTESNRMIALINASGARRKAIDDEIEGQQKVLSEKRAKLNQAEADYAETVLAIRSDFVTLKQSLDQTLRDPNVQIALRVMQTNFETPEALTADAILVSIDKRIQKIEQEVFSESIPLDVQGNSMYVDVVVGRKTTRMVVDSGASLISLPTRTAAELDIVVPSDAANVTLVVADGREIAGRKFVLDRVRVGEFEAQDVDVVVLDEAASEAEPLLGMSFLGKFKFEIDLADKSLKLLRIETE